MSLLYNLHNVKLVLTEERNDYMTAETEINKEEIATQGTINELLSEGNEDNIDNIKRDKPMVNISLDIYDGPLDALYNMVLKHKIDIQEIPIAEITTQLIEYIRNNPDMELSGDLLNIATRLLFLKSSFLLRRHQALEEEQALKEEEEEIARQLKAKLEEYSKYKELSEFIAEKLDFTNQAFFRNAPEIIVREEFSTENITKNEIYRALQQMSEKEIDNLKTSMLGKINDSKLKKIYQEKMLRVEDKIEQINKDLLIKQELIISNYIKDYSKEDKIVTFLALLEMSKAKQIYISQEINFGEIYIKKINECEEVEYNGNE